MKIDNGWHTYWKNPGASGIPLKLKTNLPEGWSIGEIQYPAPIRFTTAGLPGFGYEGEVMFPVTIFPPKEFTGELPKIRATLTWLTCNDSSCVPGNADLLLKAAESTDLIKDSYDALPQAISSAKLSFTVVEEAVHLSLHLPNEDLTDLIDSEIFVSTPDVVDASENHRFKLNPDQPNTLVAKIKKNEYLSDLPESLTVLLKHTDGRAWEVTSVK